MLIFLTLPSATVLIGVFKPCINVLQTLSTEKYPVLQLLISAPIQHFLCVLTDEASLGSCSHKNTPCFGINLTVHHELQSVPLFPLSCNLLHLPITHHLQSIIHKCVNTGGGSVQFFTPQTIHSEVVVNSCGVIMCRFHSLTPFSVFFLV